MKGKKKNRGRISFVGIVTACYAILLVLYGRTLVDFAWGAGTLLIGTALLLIPGLRPDKRKETKREAVPFFVRIKVAAVAVVTAMTAGGAVLLVDGDYVVVVSAGTMAAIAVFVIASIAGVGKKKRAPQQRRNPRR